MSEESNRPNVIFILIDDMGWKDLSCYGSTFYETPNIDRLAAEGLRFSNAYAACPVCSPTRASILTGKYPARLGVTNFIGHGGGHPSKGKLIDAPYIDHLPPDEFNLARALGAAGYTTWHVGKWHLGLEPYWPEKQGFDVNIAGCHWGMPGNGYFSPWGIPTLPDGPDDEYLTDKLADEAVTLIRKHETRKQVPGNQRSRDEAGLDNLRAKNSGSVRNNSQKGTTDNGSGPFFLYLPFYSVHIPIQAKQELIEKYTHKADRLDLLFRKTFERGGRFPGAHKQDKFIQRRLLQSDPTYAAMIESLDENIGKVLDTLDELGIADNTLVFFTSDNGGLATAEGSPTCNAPLTEGKGWMYEGGVREPLIVRGPTIGKRGGQTSAPVTSPDFYPTILEAVGLDPLPKQHVDGKSFADILRNGDDSPTTNELWNRPIFEHYPHYGNQGGTPGASVRRGDWKLIRFFEDDHEELYNLAEDIGETVNLAGSAPERRAELSEMLTEWQREIEAIIPEPNPDYEPWEGREPCGHFAGDGDDGGRRGGRNSREGSGGGPGSDAAVSDPRV